MSWRYKYFKCGKCQHVFEDMVQPGGLPDPCPECKNSVDLVEEKRMQAPMHVTHFILDYPGSKRLKAGYQHTHNRPAEKKGTQVSLSSTKRR